MKDWLAQGDPYQTGTADGRADLGKDHPGPELSRAWLKSLKEQPEPGKCATCPEITTRRIATEVAQIQGRHWGFYWVRECESCADQAAILKLKRLVANPNLDEKLRQEAQRELDELERQGA